MPFYKLGCKLFSKLIIFLLLLAYRSWVLIAYGRCAYHTIEVCACDFYRWDQWYRAGHQRSVHTGEQVVITSRRSAKNGKVHRPRHKKSKGLCRCGSRWHCCKLAFDASLAARDVALARYRFCCDSVRLKAELSQGQGGI